MSIGEFFRGELITPQCSLRYYSGSKTEGPSHDPSSISEITIENMGRKMLIHTGMSVWIEIDGRRIEPDIVDTNVLEMNMSEFIEDQVHKFTGYSLNQIERFERKKKKAKYRCCNNPDHQWYDGYPGESVCVCNNCDKHVDYNCDTTSMI